jgi:predicted nucleic acid-binding protein
MTLVEPETEALRAYLRPIPRWYTSELALTEVVRACGRAADTEGAGSARTQLAEFDMRPVDRPVLHAAAVLAPPRLRSLDAIQIATALQIADPDLVFVAYDQRCLDAARRAGLRTASPGLNDA